MTVGNVPPEWERWRGGVDQKLDTIETKINHNSTTLAGLPSDIEARIQKVINGSSSPQVTFKWIAEKLLLPIVILVAAAVVAVTMG